MSSMGHPSFALVYAGAFALYHWERLFEPIKEANDFCSYGAKMDGKGEGE